MKNIKKSFLAVFFLFVSHTITSQPYFLNDYITKGWNTTDGVPGTITDIIQSSDGYIYIGTYEGLVRFDGFKFITFNKHSGHDYSFMSARSVFEDSNKNIWVGSNDGGVEKISGDEKILFTTNDGLPNNSIRTIIEDLEGNIWIGTAGGVCYIDDSNNIILPDISNAKDLNKTIIERLFCDTSGRIWILTANTNGIYHYTGGTISRYTNFDELGSFHATAISQDSYGTLWFGLGQLGIVKLQDNITKKIITNTKLDTVPTWTICHDSSGGIWFGTEKGISLYRDGTFADFTNDFTFRQSNINKIIEDREGNIWVATDSSGLTKISLGKFRTVSLDSPVNAIAEGLDGLVWVGCDNGLYCYQNNVPITNQLTEYCKDLRIRHIQVASNGDILLNAYTKPAHIRYSKNGIKSWSTEDGLAGDKTRVSIETKNGDVYVGTTTGLSIIKPDGTLTTLTKKNGLDIEYIMCLYEDTEGFVWVGTDGGGIFIMKDGNIVDKFTTEQGLSGNVVFKITQDKNGVYWISTGTGLSRYIKKEGKLVTNSPESKFINYTRAEGLGTDSIFQILFDNSNIAWMTSNKGISSVTLSDLDNFALEKINNVDAKFYNQNDGINTAGVNSTALSMIDRHGRVWFTLVDGFAIYDPLKNKNITHTPIVHIEKIVLDGKEIPVENNLVIPSGVKRVDIEFTGLSYTAPERIRFRHKLVGFDTDFCQPTQTRVVSYTNLKPGKYKLLISAMSFDETMSSDPTVLEFEKEAFIYEQPFFWVIVGIFVAILSLVIIMIREKINKMLQLQLETQIQLKTIDLEIERDKSERLLRNILPENVANRLKVPGSKTIADKFESVTVLFLDIVNFTQISDRETPENIVNALNSLFSLFDERAEKMGVEKIKTIGDAYMAVAGAPTPNLDHAITMFNFAKAIYKDLEKYNETAKIKFSIRVGINSGSVIAGVIGKNKFIYDIWGDTVNIANRMESLCTPGKIRITESTMALLEKHISDKSYDVKKCEVKGKGEMKTFEL